MFEKIKKHIFNIKETVSTMLLTGLVWLNVNNPVFAANSENITSANATAVEGRIFGSTRTVIMALGGGAVGIGLAVIAFKMICCHKRQEARAEAMESLVWVGGGAVLLGGIAVATGFFWGNLGASN